MKLLVSLLFVAVAAVVTPVHAQMGSNPGGVGPQGNAAADDMNSISGIHRSTPKPNADGTTTAAKPTGPLAASLASDAKGKSVTSTFGPNDTVYLFCTNVTANKGDKLSVSWYGGAKDKKLTGSENVVPKDGVYNPSYNLPPAKGGSPKGTYRVDFAVNGKVAKSLKFTVK